MRPAHHGLGNASISAFEITRRLGLAWIISIILSPRWQLPAISRQNPSYSRYTLLSVFLPLFFRSWPNHARLPLSLYLSLSLPSFPFHRALEFPQLEFVSTVLRRNNSVARDYYCLSTWLVIIRERAMYTEAGVRNRLLGYVREKGNVHVEVRSRNVFLLVSIAAPSIHACLDPNRRLPNVRRCDRDRAPPSISPPPTTEYLQFPNRFPASETRVSFLSLSALEFLPFRVFLERGEWTSG